MTSTDTEVKPSYLTAPGRQDVEWGVFTTLSDDVENVETYPTRWEGDSMRSAAERQFGKDKVKVMWRTVTYSSWSRSTHGDEFNVGVCWTDGHSEVAETHIMTRLEALNSARRKANLHNPYDVRFEVISRTVTRGEWTPLRAVSLP